MIDHGEIPARYTGWERIDRPNCVQYWNEEITASIFFDNIYMETGTPVERYKMHIPLSWREFEWQCDACGITLITAPSPAAEAEAERSGGDE